MDEASAADDGSITPSEGHRDPADEKNTMNGVDDHHEPYA
jgi:hypothetical protein